MKSFWKSKTIWANVLAVAAAAFNPGGMFGHVLAPEEVAFGLGVLNLGLRLATTKGLVVSEPPGDGGPSEG